MNNSNHSIAEVELVYKANQGVRKTPLIDDHLKAYRLLMASWDMNRIDLLEEFKVVLLNRANRCLGIAPISVGGTSSCVVDAKIIFAAALKANASGIILAHNHPSGNIKPSKSDIDLTSQFVSAGKFLEIEVFDHLIVSSENYLSLAKEGYIP